MRPDRWSTFADLVGAARDTAVGAFAHQRVNLDRVVRELNPDRRYGVERMARGGLRDAAPGRRRLQPPGVTCRRADLRGQYAQLPLGFMVEFTGGEAKVEVEYLTEVIDADLVEQMLTSFVVLLGDALAQPDRMVADLRLLDDVDTAWLFRVSRGEDFVCPPKTLGGDLVAEQAIRRPDATAVVYEGRSYSYREINEAANQHAHWLAAQGVGAEDRVAVLLEKSPELVITALGIAKAGAVYLPVDPPEYPRRPHRLHPRRRRSHSGGPRTHHRDRRLPDPRPGAVRAGAPVRPGQHRVLDLHVGLDGSAQGRVGATPAGRRLLPMVRPGVPDRAGRPPAAGRLPPEFRRLDRGGDFSECWPREPVW